MRTVSTTHNPPLKKTEPAAAERNQLAALLNAGRFAELEKRARLLLDQYPGSGAVWSLLGVALQMQGKNGLQALLNATKFLPDDAEAHSNLGNALCDHGRLGEAEACYRRALQIDPLSVNAHCNLGITLGDLGRLGEAEACLRRALQIKPDIAEAHISLGGILDSLGRLEEAEVCYRRALQIKPDVAVAHASLGNILQKLDRLGEAEVCYRLALQIEPNAAEVHINMGDVLRGLGRLDEAVTSYQQALRINPGNPVAHFNLGYVFRLLSEFDKAKASYRRALEIKPDYVNAHCGLGVILNRQSQLTEAEACFRSALQFQPDLPDAHKLLGSVLKKQGRLSEAMICFRKARELGSNSARVLEALSLPAIMGTWQEVLESRVEFERKLDELIAEKITLDDPLRDIAETNFYLSYHGLNNRDLQIKVAKFYAQACPSLLYIAPHCTKPKSDDRKKIRVGFISRFMHNHSIGKTTRGILANVSRDRFHVTALFVPPLVDDFISRFIRESADDFLVLPSTLGNAHAKISELELDVLFYQDIGMEAYTYFLAYSRLAPVQCVSFGHPDTTGIPNMDYWVSSENFEPEGAQAHYSEKLYLLRNLGTLAYYYRPALKQPAKTRRDFGLPQDKHIYLCPQALFKLHPDFDAILDGILRGDAKGEVVLIEGQVPSWGDALRKRFKKTIPDISGRIRFLPGMSPDDFVALIAVCDVMLDTIHFNGMNTSLEALSLGIPVVTMPALLQRGRHTCGMYKHMNMDECIAKTPEQYISISLRLGMDRDFRDEVVKKILARNTVLYEDIEVVREFERFFIEAHNLAK